MISRINLNFELFPDELDGITSESPGVDKQLNGTVVRERSTMSVMGKVSTCTQLKLLLSPTGRHICEQVSERERKQMRDRFTG